MDEPPDQPEAAPTRLLVAAVTGPTLELGLRAGPFSPVEAFWAGADEALAQDPTAPISVVTREDLGEAWGETLPQRLAEETEKPGDPQEAGLRVVLVKAVEAPEDFDALTAAARVDLVVHFTGLAADPFVEPPEDPDADPDAPPPPPPEPRLATELPEVVPHAHRCIAHGLVPNARDARVVAVPGAHRLRPKQDGEERAEDEPEPPAACFAAVMEKAREVAAERAQYELWAEDKVPAAVPTFGWAPAPPAPDPDDPDAPAPPPPEPLYPAVGAYDTSVYDRLMSSVGKEHHTVPVFLHCLTEQVSASIGGMEDVSTQMAAAAERELAEYFATVEVDMDPTGSVFPPAPACTAAELHREPVLSADAATCRHRAHDLEGSDLAHIEADVLTQLSVPGYRRDALPEITPLTPAARERRRHRMYPFIPLAARGAERVLLIKDCEELLHSVQPERQRTLHERVFVEPIPREHLVQVLGAAMAADPFVASKYVDTLDALVVCLYQRAVPVWHRWNAPAVIAPHFAEWAASAPEKWPKRLVDFAGEVDSEATRQRCAHIRVVEKTVALGDGTVAVRRTASFGHTESVAAPAPEEYVPPAEPEPDPGKPGARPAASPKGARKKGKGKVDPAAEEAARKAEEAARKAEEAERRRKEDQAEIKAAGFESAALLEERTAVFHQGGLAFGMHPDPSWLFRRREQMEAQQLALQSEYEEALAAEDARLAALEEAGEAGERQDIAPPPAVEDPMAGVEYGVLYVAFDDGSRAVARMDHHRLELDPAMIPGVQVTFVSASGTTLEVGSGGTLAWTLGAAREPCDRRRDERPDVEWPVRPGAAERASDATGGSCAAALRFAPGCREDHEVGRMVTAAGTVIRTLESGRKDVFFPDGTRAWRNPTVEEVQERAEQGTSAFVSQQLVHAYTADRFAFTENPSPGAAVVAEGLPGHWVVVKTDGRVLGRMPEPPPPPPPPEPVTPAPGEPPADGGDPDEDPPEAEAPVEEAALPPPPPWEEWLGAVDVGEGLLEYELRELPHAEVTDPETGELVGLSAAGVLRLEPADVSAGTCVLLFPDGTRVQHGATGTIVVSREGHPEVSIDRRENRVAVTAVCADGLSVEVTPQELDPRTEDMVPTLALESTHAFVSLRHPSGSVLRSLGDGEVEVVPPARGREPVTTSRAGIAVAHCERNYVSATDGSATVVATGEADLDIDHHDLPSPRCRLPGKGYVQDGPSPVPEANPEPRLFVVYGDGSAEEWLHPSAAEAAMAARPTAEGADEWTHSAEPTGLGCTVRTVFRGATSMQPMKGLSGLQLPSVLDGLSCPPADPSTLLGTEFWKARAVFEYRELDEKKRGDIKGALEWYQYYEALMSMPPEDEKEKKKKAKAKAKAAAKKGKKKKVEEEVVPVQLPTGRKFTPYELEVETLKLRAATRARTDPGVHELIAKALAEHGAQRPETSQIGDESAEEFASRADEPSEYVPLQEPEFPERSALSAELPAARRADFPIPNAQIPTFQYFYSEQGLGWLMESGEIQRKPYEPKDTGVPKLEAPVFASAWNPMTVDELAEQEAAAQAEDEAAAAAEREEYERYAAAQETERLELQRYEQAISDAERQQPEVYPNPAPPHGLGYLGDLVRTEDVSLARPTSPPGPHPDKKSVKYDVYGEHRPVPPPAPKPFLAPNASFLEVEAETDRRVRTSSVVLKKNALLAPSVQQVRRAGVHALRGLSESRGVGAIQDADVQARDPQMTSTMQGLGDPNQLIEVQPGSIRFGALRAGGVYRLPVFLKNLDVDMTRYTVKPLEEPYLKLWYAHTPLAPGMSVKIVIEVIAHGPVKIDTFLDVRVKSHCIKVPVQARVLEAEEYDSLETESLRLHGRKLVKRGVELVPDEAYAKKVLGANFAPPIDQLGESTSLDF